VHNAIVRSLICVSILGILFSCASSPSSSTEESGTVERFGAGGIEEESTNPANRPATEKKAAPPAGIKKLKTSEALAQATIAEADMENAISSLSFQVALTSFDRAAYHLSTVTSAAERLSALRARMESVLDQLSMEVLSAPSETVSGKAFKTDFIARLVHISDSGAITVQNTPCVVVYPFVGEDGTPGTKMEHVVTDANGQVRFTAPVPSQTGKNKLYIACALTSDDPVIKESLTARRESGRLSVSFTHAVGTAQRSVPTTISILDFNQTGAPIKSSNPSATTLLKPLVQRGFTRIGMADFPNQLASGDEAALIRAATAQFGTAVQRFIYGTVRIESLAQGEDQLWSCALVAQISVWDFSKGQKVLSLSLRQSEAAPTAARAIDSARKKLAGEVLVDSLVFGL